MSTDTILTNYQIHSILHDNFLPFSTQTEGFARAIEQAVLQSAEIQALRRDAERWQAFRLTMHNEDSEILNRIKVHIENAMDNADGAPTEDQIDAAIDAAMEQQP